MTLHENYLLEYKNFIILKNFSPKSIKTYHQIVHYYLRYCIENHPDQELTDDLAKEYLLYRYSKGLDWQTINSDFSSIQKFYKNIILKQWNIKKIPRPRKAKKLPTILSK